MTLPYSSAAFDQPGKQRPYRAGARKVLVAFAVYLLACLAFELAERRTFQIADLPSARAIKDPEERKAAIRVREERVNQMEESAPYLVYLSGSLLAGIAIFVAGLFRMRLKLRPWLANEVAAHHVYIPLLLVPMAAMMAVMAPPWLIPYALDGHSWAELIRDLNAPLNQWCIARPSSLRGRYTQASRGSRE